MENSRFQKYLKIFRPLNCSSNFKCGLDFFLLSESPQDFKNILFLKIDFSQFSESKSFWKDFPLQKTSFWGCTFSENFPVGAFQLLNEDETLPFQQFREKLYSQEELEQSTGKIEHCFHQNKGNLLFESKTTLHDLTLFHALNDLIKTQNKPVLVFFGGHSLKRNSIEYKSITLLSKFFAESGYLIVAGGGPGTMEAVSLGSYLGGHTEREVDEALSILAQGNELFENEYENIIAAQKVIDRFGNPSFAKYPCIGVPTFIYSDEPSNKFSTSICKMFSKSTRHSTLIDIADNYVICPGSYGTREELFAAICKNADLCYENKTPHPIVFFGETYWKNNGIYPLVNQLSSPYSHLLLLSDKKEEIHQFLQQFN